MQPILTVLKYRVAGQTWHFFGHFSKVVGPSQNWWMRLNNNNFSYNVNCSGVPSLWRCSHWCRQCTHSHGKMTSSPHRYHQTMATPIMTKKCKLDPAYSNISAATTDSVDAVKQMDSSYWKTITQLEPIECHHKAHAADSRHQFTRKISILSCLWQLLSNCPVCAAPCAVIEQYEGTLYITSG